jgi:hypothetical protein
MHNGLEDKGRRLINLRDMRVGDILPEHFAASYPKFIELLESYYEFENEYDSTELLNHLFQARDITETDITLLNFIEDELLLGESYAEGFNNIRAQAQFSSVLFRSKGSKYSIEWFFRSFFGVDAEVLYPKENIFNVGESQIGPDTERYLTNDELYQTFALLVRTEIPLSQWKDIFKLFVHPAGMYLGGSVLIDRLAELGIDLEFELEQANSPTYSFTGSTVTEGSPATVDIVTTNVGDTNLFYYVIHGTTIDADFTTPPPTDVNNLQSVAVTSNSGQVALGMAIDGSTEPNETFTVVFYDGPVHTTARLVGTALCTVQDVQPVYRTVRSLSSITEGGSVSFTVTQQLAPGYEDFNYTISGLAAARALTPTSGTITAADFLAGGGSANINVNTTLSTAAEGNETITFAGTGATSGADEQSSADASTPTVSVVDASQSFSLIIKNGAVTTTQFEELDTITVEFSSTQFNAGTVFLEIINDGSGDVAASDFTNPSTGTTAIVGTPQSITCTGNPDTFTYTIDVADDADTTLETFRFRVYDDVSRTTTLVTSDEISLIPPGNMTLVAKLGSVQQTTFTEGDTITFEAGGTGLSDGTYHFGLVYTTADANDFTTTPPIDGSRESLTVSGGVFTTQPTALALSTTGGNTTFEDDETFTAEIRDANSGGVQQVVTGTLTIQDADPTYAVAFDVADIDEDETEIAAFDVTGTNVENGTTVGYTISGVTVGDILLSTTGSGGAYSQPGALTGTISMNSNAGALHFKAQTDATSETSETMTVTLDATDSKGDATSSPSDSVIINDTSTGSVSSYVLLGPSLVNLTTSDQGSLCNIEFNSSGVFEISGQAGQDTNARPDYNNSIFNGDGTSGGTGRWLSTGGSGSDYEIRVVKNENPGFNVTISHTGTSLTFGTWTSLSSTQDINVSISATDFVNFRSGNVVYDIQIREAGSQDLVLDTQLEVEALLNDLA